MRSSPITVATWNFERQGPRSSRAQTMLARLAALEPALLCLTEAHSHSTSDLCGHAISTEGVQWSASIESERKVVLWSRTPWHDVDMIGAPECEAGAFIQGLTETPLGALRIIGVCIPYAFASPIGRVPKAMPWSEHLRFLEGLTAAIAARDKTVPCLVLGDFNQFVPRIWGPKAAATALTAALGELTVATAGPFDGFAKPAIDHIAHCPLLRADPAWGLSAIGDHGERLSDHFGVAVSIARSRGA